MLYYPTASRGRGSISSTDKKCNRCKIQFLFLKTRHMELQNAQYVIKKGAKLHLTDDGTTGAKGAMELYPEIKNFRTMY